MGVLAILFSFVLLAASWARRSPFGAVTTLSRVLFSLVALGFFIVGLRALGVF